MCGAVLQREVFNTSAGIWMWICGDLAREDPAYAGFAGGRAMLGDDSSAPTSLTTRAAPCLARRVERGGAGDARIHGADRACGRVRW